MIATTDPTDAPSSDGEDPRRHRRVRSFVLRMGRMTASQQRALGELWPVYGLDFQASRLDLDTCFGRRAARMLEIGFGTGDALLSFAQSHPDHDCIGIEVHRPGAGHLLLLAEAAGTRNLRVICHDAVEVLEHCIAPGTLDAVHIFFPDPWPKTRHHKRRLIQPEFVERLAQVLRPGGMLRLATDWEHYAHQMTEVIDANAAFVNTAGEAGFVQRPADRPLTRFERRGRRLGHGVWDLAYARRDG